MAKTIFVFSASVGAGHLRAAQAIELTLKQVAPDIRVKNMDVLQLTNAAFRRMYGQAYIDLVNNAPHVLGYIYDMMDKPSKSGKGRADKLRLLFEKLNLKDFITLLHDDPPSLIINTHILSSEIIASLRRDKKCDIPQVIVTTDFDTHRMWVHQPCEHYFVATEEGAVNLASWGVPKGDISVTGIPIHPVFAQPKSRADCLARHGVAGDRPVILQLAGGFGVGPIEKIHQSLLSIERPLDVVVVAGRNAEAKASLEALPCPTRHRRHIVGFTDQMDEFLAIADLVVSKPGGLTTSETLARGAVMVILDPIPGQESRNNDFLLENSAAIKVNNLSTLAYKISQLLDDPQRLATLKANAQRLGRPRAAFDIVKRSLALIGESVTY